MPLKPNVLREYAKDRAILPVPVAKSFVSEAYPYQHYFHNFPINIII